MPDRPDGGAACRRIADWSGQYAPRSYATPPAGDHLRRRPVELHTDRVYDYDHLHRRHEHRAEHFLAFAGTAAALIGYRRLAR
ncbi:hypothetical protein [Streptomyces sp. GC420]|uniref:hypothetical protein n=1 Tax=Streptomyces sp. GC420 TaxID=2697568 RepID=UPI001415130D|nr:hypothetical protein [Streptomyces sp. GC420]NBM16187.1 hypothetical protein [Streptomyces sp. GC420]